nr:hypothetical protein [Nostoc sp. ChiSLP03a]
MTASPDLPQTGLGMIKSDRKLWIQSDRFLLVTFVGVCKKGIADIQPEKTLPI